MATLTHLALKYGMGVRAASISQAKIIEIILQSAAYVGWVITSLSYALSQWTDL